MAWEKGSRAVPLNGVNTRQPMAWEKGSRAVPLNGVNTGCEAAKQPCLSEGWVELEGRHSVKHPQQRERVTGCRMGLGVGEEVRRCGCGTAHGRDWAFDDDEGDV
jgi:hypothetical protein